MRDSLAIISLEDVSNNSGFVNKYYQTIDTATKFEMDIAVIGNKFDLNRIENPKKISVISKSNSKIKLYWYLLTKRPRYTFMQLSFDPFFFLQVVIAKIAGSQVIIHMGDPLYKTLLIMKTELKSRLRFEFVVSITLFISKYIELMLLFLSDYIFVTTPNLRHEYLRIFGNRKYVGLTLNYIPTEVVPIISGEIVDIHKRFDAVLVYFGQIQPEIRGYESLLAVFSRVKRQDCCLVFLGEDRTHGAFKQSVSELNLDKRVFHMKPIRKEHALWCLKNCDFLVVGEYSDCFLPNKFFDAYHVQLSMLLPVNLKQAKEIFGDLVTTYNDETDLIEKIENMERYKNKSEYRKISTYASIMERFFREDLGLDTDKK